MSESSDSICPPAPLPGAPRWLWVMIVAGCAAGVSFPFLVRRTDAPALYSEEAHVPLEKRIFWLHPDQIPWLDYVRDFPAQYRRDRMRVSRPVYPLVASVIARTSQVFHDGFTSPSSRLRAYVAGVMVNVIVYVLSVIGLYRLVLRWRFPGPVAAVGAALLAASPVAFQEMSCVGTLFVPVGIFVGAAWLFTICVGRVEETGPVETTTAFNKDRQDRQDVGRSQSCISCTSLLNDVVSPGRRGPGWFRSLLCGLGLGALMLVKPHYDVLAVGWIVLAYEREWRALAVTFLAHFIPLLIWIAALRLMGLAYYHWGWSAFGHGHWFLAALFEWPVMKWAAFFATHVFWYLLDTIRAYGPLLFFAFLGLRELAREGKHHWVKLSCAALAVNFLFSVAIRKTAPYLMFESFFVMLPLAAKGILGAVETSFPSARRAASSGHLAVPTDRAATVVVTAISLALNLPLYLESNLTFFG